MDIYNEHISFIIIGIVAPFLPSPFIPIRFLGDGLLEIGHLHPVRPSHLTPTPDSHPICPSLVCMTSNFCPHVLPEMG